MKLVALPAHWLTSVVAVPLRWLRRWWQIVHFGALALALAASPASYRRGAWAQVAQRIYLDTAPALAGFVALSALAGLVLTRIVLVTALGVGLSRYALEMVLRVLVVELIPLAAALFVALRTTLPAAAELARQRRRGELEALRARGADPMIVLLLPRLVSGLFGVVMLAAASSVTVMVLAYISVHGFSWAGFVSYTQTVGRVFDPVVTLLFVLKTLLFALSVTLVPLAAAWQDLERQGARTELQSVVRVFVLLLLIEFLSLVGNYY